MKTTKKPRTPEVKTVTLKFKTTLANATLRIYTAEAARLVVKWAKAGATPELSPIVQDRNIALVAKSRVEAVGKR